jgi:hypothetical protein
MDYRNATIHAVILQVVRDRSLIHLNCCTLLALSTVETKWWECQEIFNGRKWGNSSRKIFETDSNIGHEYVWPFKALSLFIEKGSDQWLRHTSTTAELDEINIPNHGFITSQLFLIMLDGISLLCKG